MSWETNNWIGKVGNELKEVILKENPELKVHIVHKDAMVTMDYSTSRIRIFVDDEGKIVQHPTIG